MKQPSEKQLEKWMEKGRCKAVCEHGCWVEPDGQCPHGKDSWLLELGLI